MPDPVPTDPRKPPGGGRIAKPATKPAEKPKPVKIKKAK